MRTRVCLSQSLRVFLGSPPLNLPHRSTHRPDCRSLSLAADSRSEHLGCAWLFFGCRTSAEDYLYKSDLQGFVVDKTLDRLELAFSREQARKVSPATL